MEILWYFFLNIGRFPALVFVRLVMFLENVLSLVHPKFACQLRYHLTREIDGEVRWRKQGIKEKTIEIGFYTPNPVCAFRFSTFAQKEPEMLAWLEEFGGGGAFYDVGANIGLYSIYYAQIHSGPVYSFEPSVFNLRQLVKNINLNGLADRIVVIPNPLSDRTHVNSFANGSSEEGGALSTFGVNFGFDGQPLEKEVEYQVLGFSIDELRNLNLIKEPPSLLKIDVDGIEHLILSGARDTLFDKSLRSVFVEVNDNFDEQRERVSEILTESGFLLKEKTHSELIKKGGKFNSTYNQIWVSNETRTNYS